MKCVLPRGLGSLVSTLCQRRRGPAHSQGQAVWTLAHAQYAAARPRPARRVGQGGVAWPRAGRAGLRRAGAHACSRPPVGARAGPTGKILLMPEDPNAVFIMVATGTGIAPYRAFLRRMFMEDVPTYKFTGLAWLFMGVANSDAKLYVDEFQEILNTYPDQARAALGAAP